MQKITLSDYEEAITKYRKMAISMGAKDVIQCGSVRDPGISDIDCILLVENWAVVRNSWKLLNPEVISPLFTHGPFVCPHESLLDLMKYTTLRPMNDSNYRDEPILSSLRMRLVIAARQSRSLLHFSRILFMRRGDRQVGLVLKSVLHTMRDCSIFFDKNDNFDNEIVEYERELNVVRKCLGDGVVNQQSMNLLKQNASRLVSLCINRLAAWIRVNFHMLNTNDVEVISCFPAFVCTEEGLAEYSPELVDEILCLRKFIDEINVGYISYGALWRGAELPFHEPNLAALGHMIWGRRFIKKAMVPVVRMCAPQV
tara:strand:- start:222326 stop:223264 length:939 start_codon:yes stop_codon:yes gene_type:complete